MHPDERNKIIANNRSLRNIKNELENLAESGAISDEAYETIMRSLPNESSLNAKANPASSTVPTNSFNNLNIGNSQTPPPPSYNTTGPPTLPSRQTTQPAVPEVGRAIALYPYTEPGDCNFETQDQISIISYVNAEWWMGRNLRTGQEGVFPASYVQKMADPSPSSHNAYGNEKQNYNQTPYQQQQAPPPAPGPSNPYNSAVQPMQIAEQPTESKPGKGQEMGKKFGKKLGNAAIFGAGATIGGNLVNSIF